MNPRASRSQGGASLRGRPFLGIHFVRCGAYGRIYKNTEGTAYVGGYPRCMHPLRVKIGKGGTNHRFFKCFCP